MSRAIGSGYSMTELCSNGIVRNIKCRFNFLTCHCNNMSRSQCECPMCKQNVTFRGIHVILTMVSVICIGVGVNNYHCLLEIRKRLNDCFLSKKKCCLYLNHKEYGMQGSPFPKMWV